MHDPAMHIRCPHCRNPIEVVNDMQVTDLTCTSCGSSFSLVGSETMSYRPTMGEQVTHFELLDELGTGAFGTVWKARDTELDRIVAVKVPRVVQLGSEETEMFLREARAAAQLRHPNIVSVHEVGRDNDTIYIVSDFVDGLTLADWLTGQQPTMREAAELVITIARALDYAHETGVIHRDLKPGNIMLDRDGQPFLMDFGLAKREAGEITMTVEGQILGTPAYMSPEQARGEGHTADRRTDIYSLGAILFELLTGERPFRGNTRMLLHQVLHDDAPSPRKLNAQVPRDLETICLRCLEKDPETRYATAADVADELQRWLDGKPIQARPIGRIERGWRWCRRNPAATAVAMLAPVALLAIAIATVSAQYQSRLSEANTDLTATLKREKQLAKELQASLLEAESARSVAEASLLQAEETSAELADARGKLQQSLEEQIALKAEVESALAQAERAGQQLELALHRERIVLNELYNRTEQQGEIDIPRLVLDRKGPFQTRSVGFSHDSRSVFAAGLDKAVHVWPVDEMRSRFQEGELSPSQTLRWEIARGNRGGINVMAISPTRKQIAIGGFSPRGSNGDIIILDTDRAEVETSLPIDRDNLTALPGHRQAVTGLDYSPDGNRVVSVSFDGEIWVWTAPAQPGAAWTPQLIRQPQGSLFDRQPAIFLDNNTIVAAERVNVKIDTQWRLALYNIQGQRLGVLPTIHDIRVSALTRAADGTTWFSASGRDHNNIASDSSIYVWTGPDQQQPRVLRSSNREPSSLSSGPGGLLAASSFLAPIPGNRQEAIVELWDVAQGRMIDQVTLSQHEHCLSCQISQDGTRLVAHGSDQHELLIFDLLDADGQLLPQPLTGDPPVRLRGRGRDVYRVAFAVPPEGAQVPRIGIGQSADSQIHRVLSPAEGTLLPPTETDRFIEPTAFSDNWSVEFNSANIEEGTQNVTFRHPQRGASTIVLNVPRQGKYRGVHCFIPDAEGRAFAVALGTQLQNGIFVYQLPIGRPARLLRYFRGHEAAVTSLGVSEDGRLLISGSRDQTAKVWSLNGLVPFNPEIPEWTGWGAEFGIENGQVVARNVLSSGIAFARRVRNGDVIAQIEFRDANGALQQPTDAQAILDRLRTQPLFETLTVAIRPAGRGDALDIVPVVLGWEPLLTLFADEVGEWAIVTPMRYYDHSSGGGDLIGWQFNRGRSETPGFKSVAELKSVFHRPHVLMEALRKASVFDGL